RLRKGADANSLELDEQFVPPLVDVAASPYLDTIVRRLLEIMSGKSAELAGMRRHRNFGLAEFSAADIPNFWLLYTVNTYLPVLRHIAETKKGHPATLFDTMLSMAGALTTFSPKIQPKDLPTYDHEDLGERFRKLDETVRELLRTPTPANFVSLPLKSTRKSVHSTPLSDDRYLSSTHVYLAVTAEMPEAELITRAPQLLKVSSADRVEELMIGAVGGVQLSHVSSPPVIPVKLPYQYFALNQTDKEWDAVKRARNLAVYVPDNFVNARLELWMILPQG